MRNLNQWNPFEQLKPLTSGMNELNQKKFLVPKWMTKDKAESFYRWQPHLDLKETAEAYVMEFIFDDVDKADVRVAIKLDRLSISAKRPSLRRGLARRRLEPEVNKQVYKKIIHLPAIIDRENISAAFDDGHLNIVLPKLTGKSRQINIA